MAIITTDVIPKLFLKDKIVGTLKNKKLDDLEDYPKVLPTVEPIDPTPSMIMDVIEALRHGTELREIQLTVVQGKRILSMDQIKAIKRERLARIAELLAPEPEPEPHRRS